MSATKDKTYLVKFSRKGGKFEVFVPAKREEEAMTYTLQQYNADLILKVSLVNDDYAQWYKTESNRHWSLD